MPETDAAAAPVPSGPDVVTAPDPAITPEAVQASFERLSAILADMMMTAGAQSRHRCPYKDRNDRCTAGFGCRNQRRIPGEPAARRCAGDDRLDHRSAWETP